MVNLRVQARWLRPGASPQEREANLKQLLTKFDRELAKCGILRECRSKMYFESETRKRRRKDKEAKRERDKDTNNRREL